MCLSTLKPMPRHHITRGYTVVRPGYSGTRTKRSWIFSKATYKTRVWYWAQRLASWNKPSLSYPPGFHVFINKKDATRFWDRRKYALELWECDIKDITAYGTQFDADVAVVKQRRLAKCLRRRARLAS